MLKIKKVKEEEDDILNNDIMHIKNENTHKKYDVTCTFTMLVRKDGIFRWCEIFSFRKSISLSMNCELFNTFCMSKVFLRRNISKKFSQKIDRYNFPPQFYEKACTHHHHAHKS